MLATLTLEREDGVARLGLHRPEALNAVNRRMVDELRRCFRALADEEATRAIVLHGDARVFSAGADVKELRAGGREEAAEFIRDVARLLGDIASCPKVTVAAMTGNAFGAGADIALACDVRVAAPASTIRFPGMAFGVILGTRRLEQLVGPGRARMIVFGQEAVPAGRAKEIGLVDVVAEDEVLAAACALASRMARIPPHAVAGAKRLLDADPAVAERDVEAAYESVKFGDFQARLSAYLESGGVRRPRTTPADEERP